MKFPARTAWERGEGKTNPLAVEMIFSAFFPFRCQTRVLRRNPSLLSNLAELFDHVGDDRESIADNAKMGAFENRRLPHPVDGDNEILILHSQNVLDRPRNPTDDIDFWPDGFAGLAYQSLIGRSPGERLQAMLSALI